MIYTLPGFLKTYWYYVLGAVILCAILSYYSETFYKHLKKGIVISLVLFAVIAGYELITGDSVISLPTKVEKEFIEDTSHMDLPHYYESYEKRYGEKPPE